MNIRKFQNESAQNLFQEITLTDTEIQSKLDLTKPVNFVIHGYLGGLDVGMNL